MTEFWSGSFATKVQFKEFIRTEAQHWFEPDDIWYDVHDDCSDYEQHSDCIEDGELWAQDHGYHEAIDYSMVARIHDDNHIGSVKWCTIGLCAPVAQTNWFGHLYDY